MAGQRAIAKFRIESSRSMQPSQHEDRGDGWHAVCEPWRQAEYSGQNVHIRQGVILSH